jgi:hypothetical protein
MSGYKAAMARRSVPFWVLLVLYWSTIAYFTHMPAPEFRLPGQDKTAHYIAYGALGGLMYLALWTNNRPAAICLQDPGDWDVLWRAG